MIVYVIAALVNVDLIVEITIINSVHKERKTKFLFHQWTINSDIEFKKIINIYPLPFSCIPRTFISTAEVAEGPCRIEAVHEYNPASCLLRTFSNLSAAPETTTPNSFPSRGIPSDERDKTNRTINKFQFLWEEAYWKGTTYKWIIIKSAKRRYTYRKQLTEKRYFDFTFE